MADKISPASKPVAKSDGLKMGSANETTTTPNPTFGRYWGDGKTADKVKGSGSIFGKD